MALNKILLIGNVGRDPEIRQAGDNKVASFTLATTEKYRDRSGQTAENTEWHNIVIWGKLAEVAEKYVTKGTQLYIEGKIKTEKYTANDGTDRFSVKVYASSLQLLGGKKEGAEQRPSQPAYQNGYSGASSSVVGDMPF